MTSPVDKPADAGLTISSRSWAAYVNESIASIEQVRSVMKLGGLTQPGVAEHLQSSRASSSMSMQPLNA